MLVGNLYRASDRTSERRVWNLTASDAPRVVTIDGRTYERIDQTIQGEPADGDLILSELTLRRVDTVAVERGERLWNDPPNDGVWQLLRQAYDSCDEFVSDVSAMLADEAEVGGTDLRKIGEQQ